MKQLTGKLILVSILVLAGAAFASDGEDGAGSNDVNGCFECNKNNKRDNAHEDSDATKAKRSLQDAKLVFGNTPENGPGTTNAIKEGPKGN